MNKIYNLFILISIVIIGCKSKDINDNKISQSINSLDMTIFSKEGKKLISIVSPYSNYDKEINTFNLKETTINLFKNSKLEYIINADSSKLSNKKNVLELNGNVIVKSTSAEENELYANSFIWKFQNSKYLLIGNVKFQNNTIILSSDKAILNKTNNIIEFFNPVKYKIQDSANKNIFEIKSQNAYYNINTKSVSFTSNEDRVRSKIYF